MKKLIVFTLILMSLVLTGCDSISQVIELEPVEINIMAVSSLKNPLNELKKDFEKNNSNIKLNIDYSSSQEITDNILEGELTDFVILSAQRNMDQLANKSLIDPATRTVLVSNTLVAVAAANSELASLDDLKSWEASNIVIGNPETTSSGRYAEDTLEKLGLSEDLTYKAVYEKNMRLLVDLLSKNNNYGGIMFKSDAVGNDKVKIVYEFPVESYDTINYPMAETSDSELVEECTTLETYLQSSVAQDVFKKYGYNSVSATPAEPPAAQETSTEEVAPTE